MSIRSRRLTEEVAIISQAEAIRRIRATGISEAGAAKMVGDISRKRPYRDGKRTKLFADDIDRAIADVLRPTVARKEKINNVKPFSPRLANRIRRSGARV
jgi:hypothetical protein